MHLTPIDLRQKKSLRLFRLFRFRWSQARTKPLPPPRNEWPCCQSPLTHGFVREYDWHWVIMRLHECFSIIWWSWNMKHLNLMINHDYIIIYDLILASFYKFYVLWKDYIRCFLKKWLNAVFSIFRHISEFTAFDIPQRHKLGDW